MGMKTINILTTLCVVSTEWECNNVAFSPVSVCTQVISKGTVDLDIEVLGLDDWALR